MTPGSYVNVILVPVILNSSSSPSSFKVRKKKNHVGTVISLLLDGK